MFAAFGMESRRTGRIAVARLNTAGYAVLAVTGWADRGVFVHHAYYLAVIWMTGASFHQAGHMIEGY
jgi:hypothetical protein